RSRSLKFTRDRARGFARTGAGRTARAPRRRPGVAAVGAATAEFQRLKAAQNTVAVSYSEVAVRLAIFVGPHRHRTRRESHGPQRGHHRHIPDDSHGPIPLNPPAAGSTPETVGAEGGEIGTCAIGPDGNPQSVTFRQPAARQSRPLRGVDAEDR